MKIPIISRFFEKRSEHSGLSDPKQWLIDLFGGRPSKAGVTVTETNAMQLVAVMACVRVIAETIASLPLPVYRRLQPRGKQRAPDYPLYKLLHDQPNPEMTAFTFKETAMAHILLWGNCYAEIEYDRRTGEIMALWPLPPNRVEPKRTDSNEIRGIEKGELFYQISMVDGTIRNLPSWQVLHIPGLGFNGIKGFSPIQMAKDAIGLGMALEQFGSEYFKNGANVGAVVTHPGKLSDNAFTRLTKSLREKYEGLGKAHRLMLLEEGMSFAKNTIPPNDSQFLESRKFQRTEIASIFRVPPHMIGDLERATFSNIEHQSIDFITQSIRPWLVRWEQSMKWKLFEDETYFAEFLVEGMLRGDIQTRYAAYAVGRQWGWLSANDVRELENLNPLGDEGDIYLVPMNMIPADQARMPEPNVSEPNEEEDRSAPKEERNRAALARYRTALSYRKVFEDAATRIVRREKEKVLAEAKKQLSIRDRQLFFDWLDEFYRTFPDYITRQMSASADSLASAIKSLAEQEANSSSISIDNQTKEYLESFAARYSGSSRSQLKYVINKAIEDEMDMLEAVEERLGEWEKKRPGKVASNEVIQLGGFIAKTVFAAAGLTRLRWVNTGSDTCPFCSQLDGKIVGIEEDFLLSGQEIVANDGSGMRITGPKSQPPIHQGCQCTITFER